MLFSACAGEPCAFNRNSIEILDLVPEVWRLMPVFVTQSTFIF
jgi:hypothetical protein